MDELNFKTTTLGYFLEMAIQKLIDTGMAAVECELWMDDHEEYEMSFCISRKARELKPKLQIVKDVKND